MSDLQISLLAMGAVVVAGVYLFNLRQERMFRQRVERAFAQDHSDVLLDDGAGEAVKTVQRVEPTLDGVGALAAPSLPVAAVAADIVIDPVIDYVVEANLPVAADGAELRDELGALMSDTKKRVLAEGYAADSGDWVDAGSGGYARLRFALQMSNREGCVTQNQLTTFRDAVARWADGQQGEFKSLEVEAAHAMAVQLDRFCADVDIAIGINVVSSDGSPFTGVRIRAIAEQNALRLGPDGVFYAHGDNGEVLFTLDNHEPMPFVPEQLRAMQTRGVTFLLDVPRVATSLAALDTMLAVARAFAAEIGGMLVDDNRAQLSETAIAAIRRQLEGILGKMEAGRIPAGGARALRLFA